MGVERGHRTWQVHVDGHLDSESLRNHLAAVRDGGGGEVYVWVSSPTEDDDAVAATAGLSVGRDLYELRTPLPLAEPVSDLSWRPFRTGDEDAWLAVNNRAFHWHPEQGGWTRDILAQRLAEPWVDLEGFLLHERDDRLAAFCWTKVHADHDPTLGEIYVIGVDPDFQGLGLGKAMTLLALDWLHHQRNITMGNLYVDASNTTALTMYERLGFTRYRTDRAYFATL